MDDRFRPYVEKQIERETEPERVSIIFYQTKKNVPEGERDREFSPLSCDYLVTITIAALSRVTSHLSKASARV